MPREANKTREWEKERRNRLNDAFEALCKLLPSYDPAISSSKIEILRNAALHIQELQDKIKGLIAPNAAETVRKVKGEEIRKLQERIKRLLTRNEHLCGLLRTAKITIPPGCVVARKFRNPRNWSERITPEQAKVLQRKEQEKENVAKRGGKFANKAKAKTNPVNGAPKHRKAILNRTDPKKLKSAKRRKGNKLLAPAKCVIVLSQPTPTQSCYVITNASSNNLLGGASTVITNSNLLATPLVSTNAKSFKAAAPAPPLGPGTLILANGTIVPLVPQPTVLPVVSQIITKPLSVRPQNSTVILLPRTPATPQNVITQHVKTSEVKTLPRLKPKYCLTLTTQVNKVPIPALTSRYANNDLVLRERKNEAKAAVKKTAEKKEAVAEKSGKVDAPEEPKKTGEAKEKRKLEGEDDAAKKMKKLKVEVDTEAEKSVSDAPKTVESSEQAGNDDKSDSGERSVDAGEKKSQDDQPKSFGVEEGSAAKEIEKYVEKVVPEVAENNKQAPQIVTQSAEKEKEETAAQEMKSLELNINHSELSNDIFASLQVPAGCQNPESTSPTAAFLLAFPLVSSLTGVKVTEVTEEDNAESQRGTPTLLQIGTMDATKPTQSESLTPSLLNLDNLSFFSSKDICGGFYSSFETSLAAAPKSNVKSDTVLPRELMSSKEIKLDFLQGHQSMSQQHQYQQQKQLPQQRQPQQPQSQQLQQSQPQTQQSHPQLQESHSQPQPSQPQQSRPQPQQSHSQPQQSHSQPQQSHPQPQQSHSQPQQSHPQPQQSHSQPQQSHPQRQQSHPQPQSQSQQSRPQPQQSHLQPQQSHSQPALQLKNNLFDYNNVQNFANAILPRPDMVAHNETPLNQPLFGHQVKPKQDAVKNLVTKQGCANYVTQNKPPVNYPCGNFADLPKVTSSYSSVIKSYPDPLYTNSNTYSYSYPTENNFNQNYYKNIGKNDNRNYYSLNYENYSDYRKNDANFSGNYYGNNNSNCLKDNNNKFPNINATTKTKTPAQTRPPINWMTTPDNKVQTTADYVLPQFTKQGDFGHNSIYPTTNSFASNTQSYFNTNPVYPNGNDVVNAQDNRKTLDLPLVPPVNTYQRNDVEENQFSWSPTKIPQFLDPSHSFVSSTLPTLVGDLALGNPLTFAEPKNDQNKCQNKKDNGGRRVKGYENNQTNFLSVSQLVDHNKNEPAAARTTTRRNSGNRSKKVQQLQKPGGNQRTSKPQETKDVQNYPANKGVETSSKANQAKQGNSYNTGGGNDLFCDASKTNNRNAVKNASTNYSAEALIGHQMQSSGGIAQKNRSQSNYSASNKSLPTFLPDNIIPYFPPVDLPQDNSYMQQNQNYQTGSFGHNYTGTFQNNTTYAPNTFIPAATTITSTYLSTNNFMQDIGASVTHDFTDNLNLFPAKDKSCNKSSNRTVGRDQQNSACPVPNATKKSRKKSANETGNLPSFVDFSFLSIPGSISSPILPDDFHAHSGFLQPPTPQLYPCKNPLYPKQNDLASGSLLPLPPVPGTRSNIQHPEISPSINNAGTSLTNFNLSTIFPEINKGALNESYLEPRIKEHPARNYTSTVQVTFSDKPTFSFNSYINSTASQPYTNQ